MRLKTTLEQWNTLRAIDKSGSIQAAALLMNKSHTTLIYSVKKLEQQLGISLVRVVRKKAELTEAGQSLLRYANTMLDQAVSLEAISMQLAKGTESEIVVTVDHLCNKEILYRAMKRFFESNQMTSVKVIETSLTSTVEAVTNQLADVALINLPVTNFSAESIDVVSMIPVAAHSHWLATKTELTMADLTNETQVVLRDLGDDWKTAADEKKDVGWLKAKRRVTVDSFEQAIQAVSNGLGFTRIPEYMFENDKKDLARLNIKGASCYQVPIHITLPKTADTGPAALTLYELIIEQSRLV